jgi:hypothetical protein
MISGLGEALGLRTHRRSAARERHHAGHGCAHRQPASGSH